MFCSFEVAGSSIWMTCFTVCVVLRWSRPRGTGVLPGWLQRGFHQGEDCSNKSYAIAMATPCAHFVPYQSAKSGVSSRLPSEIYGHEEDESKFVPRGASTPDVTHRLRTQYTKHSHTHTYTFFHFIVNVNFDLWLTVQLYPSVQEAVILHRNS